VQRAIAAAKSAFQTWKDVPAPKRGEIIAKAAELLKKRKEEIARIETQEMGKILEETRADVQEGIDTAEYMAGEGRRLFGQTTPSELPNKFCMSIRRPMGIAGIISPWNFPLAIPSWKIFPALVCGNTIVFKPASDAPLTGLKLVEILIESGLPKGVINLVFGSGTKVGLSIVEHPDVDVISFTGSSDTGSIIAERAGKHLKRVALELGGKNAQIVMDDANIDLAVEGALWGAFATTGQRCTATSRLIIHKKVIDEFTEKFVNKTKTLKLGNGLDPTTDVGPLINEAQRKKVQEYIKIGKEEDKATLLLGGKIPEQEELKNGFFFLPTIFTHCHSKMRICQEEIFGPVVTIIAIESLEEAISVLNDTQYGLSSSIYTQDVNKAFKAIKDLHTGITYINGPTIGAETHLPFGGTKRTGNGHRESGTEVLNTFSEWKSVYIDYSGKLQKAQIDSLD
jgi:aldehyde dehydrogenase (NAD+)